MAGRMTNEEYLKTQQELQWVLAIVQQIDLSGFLENIERAEAVGSVMDPTLYMKARNNMEFIRRMAEAAYKFQREVAALKKQYVVEPQKARE